MPTCPICARPLETARQREGIFYRCLACNGRAVTISQLRHVNGELLAMKLLRLMKLSPRPSQRLCPFCGKPMLLVQSQEPLLELDACKACNAVWFDEPTYAALPDLALDSTSFRSMQATEIIALERLKEFQERQQAERKKARKKKPLHRISPTDEDGRQTNRPS